MIGKQWVDSIDRKCGECFSGLIEDSRMGRCLNGLVGVTVLRLESLSIILSYAGKKFWKFPL